MWRVVGGDNDWYFRIGAYFRRCGDALSQLINVALLFSKNPNESISGRAYRMRRCAGWKQARYLIDIIFLPLEKDHCKASYDADLKRAAIMLANKRIVECDN